jgi:hypothetical protein
MTDGEKEKANRTWTWDTLQRLTQADRSTTRRATCRLKKG